MIRQSSHGTLNRNLSTPSLGLGASSSSSSIGLSKRNVSSAPTSARTAPTSARTAPTSARTGSRRKDKTTLQQPEDAFDQLTPEQQWWQLEARRMLEVAKTFRATRMQLQCEEELAKEKCQRLKRQFEESKAEAESCTRNVEIAMDAIRKWEAKSKEVRPLFDKTQADITKKQDEVARLQGRVDELQKTMEALALQTEFDRSRRLKFEAQEKSGMSVSDLEQRKRAAQDKRNPSSGDSDARFLELKKKAKVGLIAAKRDGRLSAFVDEFSSRPEDGTQRVPPPPPPDDTQAGRIRSLCARMKMDLIAALKAGSLEAGFSRFGDASVMQRIPKAKVKLESPVPSLRLESVPAISASPSTKVVQSKALNFESNSDAPSSIPKDSSFQSNTSRDGTKMSASTNQRATGGGPKIDWSRPSLGTRWPPSN